MSYNWCHGPNCHTTETQSRVRGSKGNKVLRTIKIKQDSNYRSYDRYQMFNYFCGNVHRLNFIQGTTNLSGKTFNFFGTGDVCRISCLDQVCNHD